MNGFDFQMPGIHLHPHGYRLLDKKPGRDKFVFAAQDGTVVAVFD
jgi:hypothetical protein